MRQGFTLLEMLVATTILVVALAAIFRLMSGARRQAQAASELAVVQLACQSTMAELVAADRPIRPSPPQAIPSVARWQLAVRVTPAVTPLGFSRLMAVHVSAQKTNDPTMPPFELVRWVPASRVDASLSGDGGFSEMNSPFDLPQSPVGNPFQTLTP